MPVKIENLTMQTVVLRLNSGQTLHIPPRSTSAEIADVEVLKNKKVDKLEEQHILKKHKIENTPEATKERSPTGTHEKQRPLGKK